MLIFKRIECTVLFIVFLRRTRCCNINSVWTVKLAHFCRVRARTRHRRPWRADTTVKQTSWLPVSGDDRKTEVAPWITSAQLTLPVLRSSDLMSFIRSSGRGRRVGKSAISYLLALFFFLSFFSWLKAVQCAKLSRPLPPERQPPCTSLGSKLSRI